MTVRCRSVASVSNVATEVCSLCEHLMFCVRVIFSKRNFPLLITLWPWFHCLLFLFVNLYWFIITLLVKQCLNIASSVVCWQSVSSHAVTSCTSRHTVPCHSPGLHQTCSLHIHNLPQPAPSTSYFDHWLIIDYNYVIYMIWCVSEMIRV